MAVIEYPKFNVKYFSVNEVYLAGDDTSVTKYCSGNTWTLDSYTKEDLRFSNDGALAYQYWNGSAWVLEQGYRAIVTSITYH